MFLEYSNHNIGPCLAHKDFSQDLTEPEKALSPLYAGYSKHLFYQYQPLPCEGCIRLLWLFSGEDERPVSCRLLSVPLEDAPPYEALSYVWSDPTNTIEIICGQRRLSITVNSRDALRRFCYMNECRVLWADAICIDQQNIEKRGKQVQLIGIIY